MQQKQQRPTAIVSVCAPSDIQGLERCKREDTTFHQKWIGCWTSHSAGDCADH